MPAVSNGEQRSRILLSNLIGRVREGRTISDLLAPGADVDLVTATLRPLAVDHAVIDSIAGNHRRIDAVVTSGDVHARVVFAHDAAGLLTWLEAYLRPDRCDGVSGGRVIVINGASGAGKSTLMRALQSVATFPLVVLDEPEQMANPKEAAKAYVAHVPTHQGKEASIEKMFEMYNKYVYANQKVPGSMDESRLDELQKFYVANGVVPQASPLKDLYTNQFVAGK